MKNLQNIFDIIKKYSRETGTLSSQCFAELEKQDVNNSIFFPLFSYLRVLQGMGLIRLYKFRKVIVITEKGKATDHVPYSVSTLLIVLLHVLRRIVITAFLFLFFWPMFLAIQKQYDAQREARHQHMHG